MRTRLTYLILGAVLALTLGAVLLRAQGEWQGQRWEYLTAFWQRGELVPTGLSADADPALYADVAGMVDNGTLTADAMLNRLGADGWELVAVVPFVAEDITLPTLLFTFKRPAS